jgi:nucleotide-binding universal stress UspA family protein
MTLKTTSKQTIEDITLLQPTQTIVIPVANPNTAPPLLNIAEKLIQGDCGRIVVLFVVTGADRQQERKIAAFRSMMAEHDSSHNPISIELVTHRSTTVVDGILEIARQYDANMILLGLSYSIRGQVELGRIVESVAEQAPCDVGVYRSPRRSYIDRIVIPVGGSIASKVILKIGICLSEGFNFPCEALHIYSGTPEGEARTHVESLLMSIAGYERVDVNVVHGINEANSVLSWTNENDLMVIGFSERTPLEKWLYGDTAQRILDRARGPVLMVSRAIDDAEIQALAKRR